MARPLRLQFPGGVYHIVSRGNARREIYNDTEDLRRFLAMLRSVIEHRNLLCHAYCLMGNHYHLLLETPDGNLSQALRQLNGIYAQAFNRRHRSVGHLFQGRFMSKVIEKETYLLVVTRYIELNPVRAGLVRHPSQWEWSSYRAHAGRAEPPPFLTVDWLLAAFGAADRRLAQSAYRRFVARGMLQSDPPTGSGPILGSDSFISKFRGVLAGTAALKAIPRAQRFASRPSLVQIFQDVSSRQARNARISAAHVARGYTMSEISRHLNLNLMTISRAVRAAADTRAALAPRGECRNVRPDPS